MMDAFKFNDVKDLVTLSLSALQKKNKHTAVTA